MAFTVLATNTQAQTAWIGTDDNNWNNPNNWSNGVPEITNIAVFGSEVPTGINFTAASTAWGMQFNAGGFTIGSTNSSSMTIRPSGNTAGNPSITAAADLGNITFASPVVLAASQVSSIGSGTTINFNGGVSIGGNNIQYEKTGAGAWTFGGTRAGAGFGVTTATPILHVSGGTLNLNTTVTSPAAQGAVVVAASNNAVINALKRDQFGNSFAAVLRLSGDATFNVATTNPGGDPRDTLRFNTINFGVNQTGGSAAGGGHITIAEGNGFIFNNMRYDAADGTGTTATITGAGVVTFRNGPGDDRSFITVNDSANTSKELQIDARIQRYAIDNTNTETFTKNGAGTLVLTSNNNDGIAYQTFLVSAGTLLVNNTANSGTGRSNILVANGATLGGTGFIAPISTRSVTIQAGGILSPGDVNAAGGTEIGALTITVTGAGSSVNLGAGANFVFDLGSDLTAGVTYDFLNVSGSVALGAGTINFSNFTFNALTGFGVGDYTLISASAWTGTLGPNLTGTINGYDAFLAINGNDLTLTVIPEPATWWLLGLGLAILIVRRHARRRTA